jgi:hypothetical protein
MSRKKRIDQSADEADRLPLFAAEIRGEGEAERLPLFADEVLGERAPDLQEQAAENVREVVGAEDADSPVKAETLMALKEAREGDIIECQGRGWSVTPLVVEVMMTAIGADGKNLGGPDNFIAFKSYEEFEQATGYKPIAPRPAQKRHVQPINVNFDFIGRVTNGRADLFTPSVVDRVIEKLDALQEKFLNTPSEKEFADLRQHFESINGTMNRLASQLHAIKRGHGSANPAAADETRHRLDALLNAADGEAGENELRQQGEGKRTEREAERNPLFGDQIQENAPPAVGSEQATKQPWQMTLEEYAAHRREIARRMNVSDERFAQLYPPGKLAEEHRREILQAAERGEISLADMRDMIESAGSAEPAQKTDDARPLIEIGSIVDIAGFKGAEVADARRIDGVDYELYRNQDGGGVIRVQDAETGKTAGPIVTYSEFRTAQSSFETAIRIAERDAEQIRETQSSGVEFAGKEKKTMRQKQELSPFAKVKFIALQEAYPNLSEEEITEIALEAAEAAKQQFAEMTENGADYWATREQILHDLSQA